jgi:hypothetical protein
MNPYKFSMLVAGFIRFHFIIYYASSGNCHFQQLPFLATMLTIQNDTNSAHSCCKLYSQIRSCVTPQERFSTRIYKLIQISKGAGRKKELPFISFELFSFFC